MGINAHLKPRKLARKLKQIRLQSGLSQNEILQKMDLSDFLFQGNISQYELGRREPPLKVILAYARLAGISTDVLIDDESELPEAVK